ncbi:MAG: helix-turn-helix transcriptional regulator [Clostridia bacterium]|nr:helix-turn-helix transcriptional regulator [Clostridia bacterium]
MMKGLGETIKSLRTEKGLAQPELARLIGVSKGMISIWERNINEPKATHIKNLALALEVSSDYLLGLKDE